MFKPGITKFLKANPFSPSTRIGVVTNNTGRDINGNHLIDCILECESFCTLQTIFSPEHGFSSLEPDGEHVSNSTYANRIPIISLYGKNKIPKDSDLTEIDVLIYDIQDVGVRFYTYISTLRNILEAAHKNKIPVHILDRPDLAGGCAIEGPMLESNLTSFVSHIPVPIRYAMTPGELALWWIKQANLSIDITIWKCENYVCSTPFSKLNFPWFNPSPSMTSEDTVKFYPGTCLFEGTNLSEGRGTSKPFQNIGAPWIDSNLWLEHLLPILPPEVQCKTIQFNPTFSKFSGELCNGISLTTTSDFLTNAVEIAIYTLWSFMETHPDKIEFTGRPNLAHPFFDYLAGTHSLRESLINKKNIKDIIANLKELPKDFCNSRKDILLYERKD